MEKGFIDRDGYYLNKCGMCENYPIYNLNKATTRGFVCKIHNQGFFGTVGMAFDDSCGHYRKDRGRSHKDIKKGYEALVHKCGYYNPKRYGYHIMTAIREILGTPECDTYFAQISNLLDEYMSTHIVYFNVLASYDIYGRIVAEAMRQDEHAKEVAQDVLEYHIKPICALLLEDRYDEAITLFKEMYLTLQELYAVDKVQDKKDLYTFNSLSADKLQRIRN